MIKRFRVQNYKALRDVTLDLTPIHVLIGPNDSGKTSILEALAALCRSVARPDVPPFAGSWEGRDLVWRGEPHLGVGVAASVATRQGAVTWLSGWEFPSSGRASPRSDPTATVVLDSGSTEFRISSTGITRVSAAKEEPADEAGKKDLARQMASDAISEAHLYRWNARTLALPVAPDSKRRFRMAPSGFGLASCLDDVLGHDRDRFTALETRFRSIFPRVKSIKLVQCPAYKVPTDDREQVPMLQQAEGKGIYIEFVGGGQLVPASQLSDGMLLVLAYLTVLHLPEPPRLLLVEEPENGIHPARLQDVLTILRDLVKEQTHSQVILTTHSPYVVDLFEPDEVTLCQQGEDGSVSVSRLSKSQAVRKQLDVFTLGEIWTAEGDEALARSAVEGEGQD